MKNFVQPGNTITLTAPYAVASGDGLLVGSIFGIAAGDAALAEPVETALVGVFDITKVGSQAWTVGAKVYWDDTNKRCTTVATDNTLIGAAVEAVRTRPPHDHTAPRGSAVVPISCSIYTDKLDATFAIAAAVIMPIVASDLLPVIFLPCQLEKLTITVATPSPMAGP